MGLGLGLAIAIVEGAQSQTLEREQHAFRQTLPTGDAMSVDRKRQRSEFASVRACVRPRRSH
jgi:hypothetical protein